MIQPTYISERKCGNKWYPMDDAPVPLLRTNYLSEFRTEIEKAKARKNLGIPDEMQMKWGGMSGYVEEQRDLVEYMEMKWKYTTELSEDISTVAEALDYIMILITTYTNQREEVDKVKESINTLNKDIQDTNTLLQETEEALQKNIDSNSQSIEDLEKELQTEVQGIEQAIQSINQAINKLNTDLININVDTNILAWMQSHMSETIQLKDDKISVVISDNANNAVLNNNGLFVKDVSDDISKNTEAIGELQGFQVNIQNTVNKHQETLDAIKDSIDIAIGYDTELADSITTPNAVGGIPKGTTVGELKGKTLIDIVDILLFPTTIRDLIYPKISYYPSYSQTIEVGGTATRPVYTYTSGDGGDYTITETITYNGASIEELTTYDNLGTYIFKVVANYQAGPYIEDSKGQPTTIRVPAGSVQTSVSITTTYPWYAGNTGSVIKQPLVLFGSSSGDKTVTMGGNAIVKLPGANSKINSFTVDGGLGYTTVNLSGWTESTEELNGITYKVWTKNTPYSSDCSHKINFTLAL